MTHANVERLIGRLATDPALERRFAADPAAALEQLRREGCDLSALELDALASLDAGAIRALGAALDRRLRRLDVDGLARQQPDQMLYDPFSRGSAPVGVDTVALRHTALGRDVVPVEIWYPATDRYRGHDLDAALRDRFTIAPGFPASVQAAVRGVAPAAGRYPLVVYFHGGYGHRRDCSHLCTHLASHGYIVAAPDFPGDNTADLVPAEDGSPAAASNTPIDESARRRPQQADAVIEALVAGTLPSGLLVDGESVGTAGVSMGGFTALAVNSVSRRPRVTFAMCPMCGERSLIPQVRRLQRLLRVDDWKRPVPTLVLSGTVDPLVNVDDIRQLYDQLRAPKHLLLIEDAGHLHWSDNAREIHEALRASYSSGQFPDPEIDGGRLGKAMRPFDDLCPEAQSGSAARGLALAAMDAHLNGNSAAQAWLAGDLGAALEARGVTMEAARHALPDAPEVTIGRTTASPNSSIGPGSRS